ncbi:MAG: tetratricopeptide repeat protein [Acidobacteriota bacterium]
MSDVRLDEARRFAAAGRLKEAASSLKALLQADPENQEARAYLAEIQDRLLLELQVRDKLGKARSLADQGQRGEALKLVQDILKIMPESQEAARFKIELEGPPEDFASSPFSTVVADAADLLPDFAPSRPPEPSVEELPVLRLEALDLPSLESPAERTTLSAGARALAPAEAVKVQEYLQEGQRHYDAGRYQDAIDVWTRVFIVDEDNREAQERIDRAKGMVNAHQGEIEHYLTEGIAAFNSGEFPRAKVMLEKILAVFPTHREAQYYLARMEQSPAPEPPPAPPPGVPGQGEVDTFELEDNLLTPTGPEMRSAEPPKPAPAPWAAPPAPAAEFQLETGSAEDFPFPAPSPPAAPAPSPPPEETPSTFAWDEEVPATFRQVAPAPPVAPAPASPTPAADRPAPMEKEPKGRRTPGLTLILAVLLGLVAIGAGIFFGARYFLGESEPQPVATTPRLPKPPRPPQVPDQPPGQTAPVPQEPSPAAMTVEELLRRARAASEARDYAKSIGFYQEILSRDAMHPEALSGLGEARAALARLQEENLRNEKFLKEYLYSVKSFKEQDYAESLRVAWRLIYPDDTLARQMGKRDAVREIIRDGYYNWAVLDLRQENLIGADKNLRDLLDFDRSDAEAARLHQFVRRYSTIPPDENYRDAVRNLTYRNLEESP